MTDPVSPEGLREALLPEPTGDGWDDEVRMTKRTLHSLMNQHIEIGYRAALRPSPALATPDRADLRTAVEQMPGPDGRLGTDTVNRSDVLRVIARHPCEVREGVEVARITGALLNRAWLKSGRPDPLIDSDAWDGFALAVIAVAEIERGRPLAANEPGVLRVIDAAPDRADTGPHPDSGIDELEQRFWKAESTWAAKGSGMTEAQRTGAHMAFLWLRQGNDRGRLRVGRHRT